METLCKGICWFLKCGLVTDRFQIPIPLITTFITLDKLLKCEEQCLAHSMWSLNVSYYLTDCHSFKCSDSIGRIYIPKEKHLLFFLIMVKYK